MDMDLMTSLHTHTIFSDGSNTAEEMIEKAVSLGFRKIGITDHSYTFFDDSYCLKKDKIAEYKKEILELKERYDGIIDVKLGIEQDYYSSEPAEGYDYVIGSTHYIKIPGDTDIYIPVDESIDKAGATLKDAVCEYFDGDIYSLAEEYFRTVSDLCNRTAPDIIGHLDVIGKCNDKWNIFDEENERYIAAWKSACDILLKEDVIFEINVSPVLRGFKKQPYPSLKMQEYIRKNGGSFIYTGDCHSTDALEAFANFLKQL